MGAGRCVAAGIRGGADTRQSCVPSIPRLNCFRMYGLHGTHGLARIRSKEKLAAKTDGRSIYAICYIQTMKPTFTLQCPTCNGSITMFVESAPKKPVRAKERKLENRNRDIVILAALWRDFPEGTRFSTADVPETVYSEFFRGEKPESQFGLWLFHQSKTSKFDKTEIIIRPAGKLGKMEAYSLHHRHGANPVATGWR